jgi:hypothetical protein
MQERIRYTDKWCNQFCWWCGWLVRLGHACNCPARRSGKGEMG